jgi:hypothetical protein
MSEKVGMLGERLSRKAQRNGEVETQSRGDIPVRGGRTLKAQGIIFSKGPGRNIKIPDGLYDALCVYAIRTKVWDTAKPKGNEAKGKPYRRALTVSEANCLAIARLLGIDPTAAEETGQGTDDRALGD